MQQLQSKRGAGSATHPPEKVYIWLLLSSLLSVTIRSFTDSLFLHWSWIETLWGKTEAAGTEATQQEEVTHFMCPVELFWRTWL